MSSLPPDSDEPDDIDALYRRGSAADSSRPSRAATEAILANAAALALEAKRRTTQHRSPRQRWTIAFAGLAAAGFAGLLVTPRFFRAHPPAQSATATLEAKDSRAALASSYAKPDAAPAPVAALPPAPPTSSSNSDSQQITAGLANDLAMSARARAALPSLAEVEPLSREVSLRRAAMLGDEARVSALLAERIDVNSRDSDGRTALMLAVRGGRDNIVALLIAHGADPNATDAYGETPLRAALSAHRPHIAAALRHAGAR